MFNTCEVSQVIIEKTKDESGNQQLSEILQRSKDSMYRIKILLSLVLISCSNHHKEYNYYFRSDPYVLSIENTSLELNQISHGSDNDWKIELRNEELSLRIELLEELLDTALFRKELELRYDKIVTDNKNGWRIYSYNHKDISNAHYLKNKFNKGVVLSFNSSETQQFQGHAQKVMKDISFQTSFINENPTELLPISKNISINTKNLSTRMFSGNVAIGEIHRFKSHSSMLIEIRYGKSEFLNNDYPEILTKSRDGYKIGIHKSNQNTSKYLSHINHSDLEYNIGIHCYSHFRIITEEEVNKFLDSLFVENVLSENTTYVYK